MKKRFPNPRSKWGLACGLVGLVGLAALAIAVVGAYFYFYGDLPSAPEPEPAPITGPTVSIQSPAPGAQVAKGDSFQVQAIASDAAGVIRLDLWIDSTLVLSQQSPDAAGMNPLSLSYPMVAVENGSYALIARAYNARGEFGESAVHYVTVVEPVASAPSQEYAQYVVQPGDTLENIAARLGVSVADILRANPGLSGGALQPGQVIVIPMPKPGAAAQPAVPGPNGPQPVAHPGGGVPGGGGPAPAQPGPNPANPSNQVAVKSASVSPSPVYYGANCKAEPTVLKAIAKVEPLASISKVVLTYAFTNSAGVKSQDLEIPMQLKGSEFQAEVNVGKEAEAHLAQGGGKAELRVEAYDKDGKLSASPIYSATVTFCAAQVGGPLGPIGILPQFLPGAPQQNPGIANVAPSLFPAPGNQVFNPPNSNLAAPQNVKAAADPPECRIKVDWTDTQNETGYRVDRYEFGKPNPKIMASLSANGTHFSDDSLPQPGKYGYRVIAIQGQVSVPSAIVWVELPSSDKCKPLAAFKRVRFVPIFFQPAKAAHTQAFVQVTIGDLPTIRVPRAERVPFSVGNLENQNLEFSAPAPEQIYSQPGASLYVQVHGDGSAANQPPVDLGQFAASHTFADLTAPKAMDMKWVGEASGFKLAYRLWLEDWLWNGQATNPSLPAPTNLKLNTTDPAKRVLTWDYDAAAKDRIDGFIVYRQYACQGGDVKTQNPQTVSKNSQRAEIAVKNEPTGCACSFQVSAFGAGGESAPSAPQKESCATAQPADAVTVTFESLRTFPGLVPNGVPTASDIHLAVNEFARKSNAVVIEDERAYALNAIALNGAANNNAVTALIAAGQPSSLNISYNLPGLCQGNVTMKKQGNDWGPDGTKYKLASTNGKCELVFSLNNVSQPGGGAPVNPPNVGVPVGGGGGQPAGGGGPGVQPPASGAVRFLNKTSHPIIALLIDGVDMIQTEAQIIPTGGWLDVFGVSAGDHAYQATNGFMSGGNPQILLPLPVGTFAGNAGTVTINDPTIAQLLTNYGSQGAFVGEFWTGSPVQFHYAGFCFNSNGSFTFYIDGQPDDNGTYSLVSRQPVVYSVTFRVANSAGTEQFDGTYYYAGAFAGEMQMKNGPSDWPWIKYGRDVSCP